MKQLIILVNIVLTGLAVAFTVKIVKPLPPVSVPEFEANNVVEQPLSEGAGNRAKITSQRSNMIWERNLFHPDRAFQAPEPEEKPIEKSEVSEHFELVSIARIHDIACASIRVKQTGRAKKRPPVRRRTTRTRASNQRKVTPKKKNADRAKIYKLNEKVGETGYVLSEILASSVVLAKAGVEDIVLTLDKFDSDSETRRGVALKAEEKKSKARAAKERKQLAQAQATAAKAKLKTAAAKKEGSNNSKSTKAAAPPPPPPPPLPKGSSSGAPGGPPAASGAIRPAGTTGK